MWTAAMGSTRNPSTGALAVAKHRQPPETDMSDQGSQGRSKGFGPT